MLFSDIDLTRAIDISIPLHFNGEQPNAYGVEPATSSAYESEGIVGDTRRGGSVNFEQYRLIPHCNGTHTECVGHITHERISINDCLKEAWLDAVLVTVTPIESGGDLVIPRHALSSAIEALENGQKDHLNAQKDHVNGQKDTLIVRTLPNERTKGTRKYTGEPMPPYFDEDAMLYIRERGIRHLLTDLPSIDRLFDGGKLRNHRIFWDVEPGSHDLNETSRLTSTITELIYVPDTVEDGPYWLNLQIPPFMSDAAPSRPLLFERSVTTF